MGAAGWLCIITFVARRIEGHIKLLGQSGSNKSRDEGNLLIDRAHEDPSCTLRVSPVLPNNPHQSSLRGRLINYCHGDVRSSARA
jgi:hypothetical protein